MTSSEVVVIEVSEVVITRNTANTFASLSGSLWQLHISRNIICVADNMYDYKAERIL